MENLPAAVCAIDQTCVGYNIPILSTMHTHQPRMGGHVMANANTHTISIINSASLFDRLRRE